MTRNRWQEIYDWAGINVRDLIEAHFEVTARVLDVGAGQGKYRILLDRYPRVDGVEIHEDTIYRENLQLLYSHIYCGDICDLLDRFERYKFDEYVNGATYDVMILGDVLEHIDVDRAQDLINRSLSIVDDVFVVVPYLYPQEPHDDNEHQRHIQDDLTPEIMHDRYPDLRLVMLESRGGEPFKGIYRGR